MRCPKCGHGDYNGRCCQECGYPRHQLRSEGTFAPPPEFQKAVKRSRLPGKTVPDIGLGGVNNGPDLANGNKSKAKGCGCAVVVLVAVAVLLPLLMGWFGSLLDSAAPLATRAVPEPGYSGYSYEEEVSWEEDWDSGYEGDISLGEALPEANPQVLEKVAAQMEQSVLGEYGGASLEITLEYSDFVIMMGMGDSHFVSLALLAREGDPEALSLWEELTENLCRVGTDAYDQLVERDSGQCDADIYLYDPQDGSLYFYQSNGTVYYDYVEEGAL